MHDLKHTLLFETLLEEPFNDLVKQAVEDGDVALGYNCYYIPETLLNLPGSFSSRLRAPNCSTTPIGDYYLTNRNCPYTRAILERAVEGTICRHCSVRKPALPWNVWRSILNRSRRSSTIRS